MSEEIKGEMDYMQVKAYLEQARNINIQIDSTFHSPQHPGYFFSNTACFTKIFAIYFHYQFTMGPGYFIHHPIYHRLAETDFKT